jgi:hypothetical protein
MGEQLTTMEELAAALARCRFVRSVRAVTANP